MYLCYKNILEYAQIMVNHAIANCRILDIESQGGFPIKIETQISLVIARLGFYFDRKSSFTLLPGLSDTVI